MASTSSVRRAAAQISRTYTQASTLFLTRRLAESLSTLGPLLEASAPAGEGASDDDTSEPAPITSATQNSRIKVWSLYLTLLNAIIELGPEDGKAEVGGHTWRSILNKTRDGSIWDEVVQIGYGGVEANVDAEVVSNLATLLLAQSPSQQTNQQRLESYLSASPTYAFLNDSIHFDSPKETNDRVNIRDPYVDDKTSNPRNLASRLKILELYTLHVLPRNEEWECAREVLLHSDILDEESRDEFLRTLQSLQDANIKHRNREQSPQQKRNEEPDRTLDRSNHTRKEKPSLPASTPPLKTPPAPSTPPPHHRLPSEKDYGIDNPAPNTHSRSRSRRRSRTPIRSPPPPQPSQKPPVKPLLPPSSKPLNLNLNLNALKSQTLTLLLHAFQTLLHNPLRLLRFVLFLLALLAALSRREVRTRLRRMRGQGWEKVRGTVGMGVRVGYL